MNVKFLNRCQQLTNCLINVGYYYYLDFLNTPCKFLILGLKIMTPIVHVLEEWEGVI